MDTLMLVCKYLPVYMLPRCMCISKVLATAATTVWREKFRLQYTVTLENREQQLEDHVPNGYNILSNFVYEQGDLICNPLGVFIVGNGVLRALPISINRKVYGWCKKGLSTFYTSNICWHEVDPEDPDHYQRVMHYPSVHCVPGPYRNFACTSFFQGMFYGLNATKKIVYCFGLQRSVRELHLDIKQHEMIAGVAAVDNYMVCLTFKENPTPGAGWIEMYNMQFHGRLLYLVDLPQGKQHKVYCSSRYTALLGIVMNYSNIERCVLRRQGDKFLFMVICKRSMQDMGIPVCTFVEQEDNLFVGEWSFVESRKYNQITPLYMQLQDSDLIMHSNTHQTRISF